MNQFGARTNITTTRSVGSQATSSAMVKATNVAVGANGNRVTAQEPVRSERPLGSVKRTTHPGSRAGLNDHKVVRLQPNGSGYMNPANQTARYKMKSPTIYPKMKGDQMRPLSQPRLQDNRFNKSMSNSVAKLAKRI